MFWHRHFGVYISEKEPRGLFLGSTGYSSGHARSFLLCTSCLVRIVSDFLCAVRGFCFRFVTVFFNMNVRIKRRADITHGVARSYIICKPISVHVHLQICYKDVNTIHLHHMIWYCLGNNLTNFYPASS